MRRANFYFSIAPSYRGSTFGALERKGCPLVPSMRQEPLAQFGAIGAIGHETQFRLPFLAGLNFNSPPRFSRFWDSGKTGMGKP